MENMYSYQPTTANMQKQEEKEMPVALERFLKKPIATNFIETLACEMLSEGIGNEIKITQDFVNAEKQISDLQKVLFDWKGIDSNSEYSQILQEIIFAYEQAAFRAGFETAKQLLK